MNEYLKRYQAVMYTVGPVFIGSGKEIGKKEYLFLNKGQAGVLDIEKFYQAMSERKKDQELEAYLLGNSKDDLGVWLRKQEIKINEILPYIKYTLRCQDAIIKRGTKIQVMECMKDAYGCPYIPGSSLKGMFRTILLSNDIIQNPQKYQTGKAAIKKNTSGKAKDSDYLNRDISGIEGKAFRTLARKNTEPGDAVNDYMQGFMISDSEPLPVSTLVLCQKIERHTDGKEKSLPMLRECIRPGTEIRFTITVDTKACKISVRMIMDAVKNFINCYYSCFSSAFPDMAVPRENVVLLGGGCGYVSKTVIYPLFGKDDGLEVTQRIFNMTLGKEIYKSHKHSMDKQLGASPHILKCTKYNGKIMQMGLCRIKKITPEHMISCTPGK